MSTWGYATSIAMLIVALAAPFLGVFGDIRGMRKKLFSFFMLLGLQHARAWRLRLGWILPPARWQQVRWPA